MKKSFTQFIGGGKFSLVSIILFLIALLPSKGWAQSSYTGESGVVLTYEVSGDEVTIKGMTTAPSDGKFVIPSEIEGKAVTKINTNAFLANTSITSVEIPASITNLGGSTFMNCTNLSQVHFAEGCKIKVINIATFNGTNIKEITIPESVNQMSAPFDNCANLTSITMLSKTPCTLGRKTFDYAFKSGNLTIYVPADALEAYKTASRWSDYASIIQASAPTSINHVTAPASATSAAIYTLDGRLASKDGNTQALAKGIYVQNGKKVVIGK